MGFKGLTINTPEDEEAHIYAEDDAALFKCILGSANLLFPYGERFNVSITGSNQIRVGSGMLSIQGHIGTIPVNDYEDFILENGSSGVTRYDLLVATFETSGLHGTDDFRLEVLTNTINWTSGELDEGAEIVQMPLAKIKMNGLAISEVTMLQTESLTMFALKQLLDQKITYGTANPSDSLGNDGDIYVKILS